MASKSAVGEAISEVAHAEGGSTKGSTSAKMQSEVTKATNQGADPTAPDVAGLVIGEAAKAEGGPTKGSASAQLQSQATKQRNAEQVEADVESKLSTNPSAVTSEDAAAVQSRESRAQGGGRPPAGSLAAKAQSVAAANEQGTNSKYLGDNSTGTGQVDPATQSRMDREANFVQAADEVGSMLKNDPGSVTKEVADMMHSREHKAFGATEKGGVAAQAQSQAAKNQE